MLSTCVCYACRLMRPGDKLLLACCSYDHQRPAGDAAAEFKEHLDMAAALKVGAGVGLGLSPGGGREWQHLAHAHNVTQLQAF